MENNKKILVPTIIAVVTLVLLVFGATYAYFTVGSTNNFGTKDLNANIQDMADAVVLEQIENELSLNVTRAMMSEDNAGTTYYASGSSTPANIAKISVAGEGKYACDYTISVTKSASSPENDLHTALRNAGNSNLGVAYLNINSTQDDLWWFSSSSKTYSGTISRITKDTPQYITANLALLNKNVNQNDLKGKDITLTFEVTKFDCYLHEADESAPIYAITSKCIEEEVGVGTFESVCYEDERVIAFYQNRDEVNIGDTYDGYIVANVYKDLNNTNYTSSEDVPWSSSSFTSVYFEDIISPKNTSYWFSGINIDNIDFSNFDTSNVTDMSYMFKAAKFLGDAFSLDLSNWDVSNVKNMEGMFQNINAPDFMPNLSSWDTSNVTNMSHMFENSSWWNFILDLSHFDTSNVTNMSHMFDSVGENTFSVGNITRREVTANGKTYIAWDTSKVINMDSMFNDVGSGHDFSLDLTSWQVPLVTNHTNFNLNVEDKITPPTWVN